MSSVSREHSLLEEIRERGVIRIGCRWHPGHEQYTDPDTGQPSGIVGLLGLQLAQDLGVRAEFVDMTWADHLPALLEGRVDICLKHTNTPQRALVAEFSMGRVLRYEGKVVIRRDRGLRGEEDLNKPGRVVVCGAGASQEGQIQQRYPQAELRTFTNNEQTLLAVARGEVDAGLADASVPDFLLLHPECTILTHEDGTPVITSVDYSHPMLRPGDQRFLNWINNWMDFHEVQGTLEAIRVEAHRAFEAKFARIVAMAEK